MEHQALNGLGPERAKAQGESHRVLGQELAQGPRLGRASYVGVYTLWEKANGSPSARRCHRYVASLRHMVYLCVRTRF